MPSDADVLGIVFEDSRIRKWIPKERGREVLQNVGKNKRDCSIWEEFCNFHDIPYIAQAPQKGLTKHTAESFQAITGWEGATNEHGRDAAMLVFGMTEPNFNMRLKMEGRKC